ncbi:MAG: sporulation protein YunB, partial [Ruminococcus sp.]|nr:sporulation protein YunB [Ruminococcus sp.]
HTIKILVNADIASSIPFYKTETEVSYTYLLTETVIVGNIPDKYTVFGGQ